MVTQVPSRFDGFKFLMGLLPIETGMACFTDP